MDATMRKEMTIGEKYGPAMTITDEAEAAAYFERCVAHSMEHFGKTRHEAEELERANLGYYAGYYDPETRERVERLFSCAHPVFGKVERFGQPTPEQAVAAGVRRAQEAR
jgi:hypothetical protein